jgi:hypothetical protein
LVAHDSKAFADVRGIISYAAKRFIDSATVIHFKLAHALEVRESPGRKLMQQRAETGQAFEEMA